MRIGFDFDDTCFEHVSSFAGTRLFLLRALAGMIAIRELFIISARKATNENYTEILGFMKGNNIVLLKENLYLGFSGKKKATLAKTLDIRLFFDDDATVVASMIDEGIDSFLVGTFLSPQYRLAWLKETPKDIIDLYPSEKWKV